MWPRASLGFLEERKLSCSCRDSNPGPYSSLSGQYTGEGTQTFIIIIIIIIIIELVLHDILHPMDHLFSAVQDKYERCIRQTEQ